MKMRISYSLAVTLLAPMVSMCGTQMRNPASVPVVLADLRTNTQSSRHCEYVGGDIVYDSDAIGAAKNLAKRSSANLVLAFDEHLADKFYQEEGRRVTHVDNAQVVYVYCPDEVHLRIINSAVVLDSR